MNRTLGLIFIAASMVTLTGCLATNPLAKNEAASEPSSATTSAQPRAAATPAKKTSPYERREVTGRNDWTGYIEGKPAPRTKFNRLQIGMGFKEAWSLVGTPTDQKSVSTAKAFIPFVSVAGAGQTTHYHKGQGRLIYSSGMNEMTNYYLVGIEHDAQEAGYAK